MPLASAWTISAKWKGDRQFALDITQLEFLALSQSAMGAVD